MSRDPIIDEVWQARERLWQQAGGTVNGLLEMLRAIEASLPRPVERILPAPPAPQPSPNPHGPRTAG